MSRTTRRSTTKVGVCLLPSSSSTAAGGLFAPATVHHQLAATPRPRGLWHLAARQVPAYLKLWLTMPVDRHRRTHYDIAVSLRPSRLAWWFPDPLPPSTPSRFGPPALHLLVLATARTGSRVLDRGTRIVISPRHPATLDFPFPLLVIRTLPSP